MARRLHAVTESATAPYDHRPASTPSTCDDRQTYRAVVAAAERCIADARAAEDEYRRALADFERLMSHRIANPLQVIVGMVDTMLLMPGMDRDQRISFLHAVAEQAHILRDVCVEPRTSNLVEASLAPRADERTVQRFERSATWLNRLEARAAH